MEDKKARTWTRKLKEYFELIDGSQPNAGGKPASNSMYFFQTEARGEYTIGKRFGQYYYHLSAESLLFSILVQGPTDNRSFAWTGHTALRLSTTLHTAP